MRASSLLQAAPPKSFCVCAWVFTLVAHRSLTPHATVVYYTLRLLHCRLYSDEGFDTVKSVYAKKLEELSALGTPLETRLYEAQNRGGKYY
jgi:hypothetical protein